MKRLPTLLALLLTFGSIAAPALADPGRTGDQLNLVIPCLTNEDVGHQTADTDFHVAHGFGGLDPSETSDLGEWRFSLWVDGEQQHSFVDIDVAESGEMSRTFVSNFPGGLSAGTYAFHARWTPADGEVLDCTWDIVFEA